MMKFDTIAAIATPYGMGGIGIVRLSGDLALSTANALFQPHFHAAEEFRLRSHRIYYGKIIDPDNNSMIDEVLLLVMRAPKSYTKEDVVEIHCHGGIASVQAVLDKVLAQGVRLADPGEFTRRAFLNGRIDLSQAEAVLTMVESPSLKGAALAAPQLWGALGKKITKIENDLSALTARIETAIDFIEDENDQIVNPDQMKQLFKQVLEPLETLLANYDRYHVYREGVLVVIAGKPNVGKSSLLNALLKSDRAIVTAIPGTTRDLIEEKVVIKGIPIRLVDTAGLHAASDNAEAIGVAKATDLIAQADLVLFMVDGFNGIDGQDHAVYQQVKDRTHLIVRNKKDLCCRQTPLVDVSPEWTTGAIIDISATSAIRLTQLEEAIAAAVVKGRPLQPNESPLVPSLRQMKELELAVKAITNAKMEINDKEPLELAAESLKAARKHLALISGAKANEAILDEIFGQFCIGK